MTHATAEAAGFRFGALVPSALTFDYPAASLRSVWIALAISVVVHLSLIAYFAVSEAGGSHPPRRLLVDFVLPAPAIVPAVPVPEPRTEPPLPTLPPVPRPRASETRVAPAPAARMPNRGPLNLSVPSAVLDAEPQAPLDTDGPFDPAIASAVAKRQETRTRVAKAALRRAQREGVSSADYERDIAAGHAIKTDGGCFDLRNEQSLDPNDQMWWRTPCRDAQVSVWQQSEIGEAELHPSLRTH